MVDKIAIPLISSGLQYLGLGANIGAGLVGQPFRDTNNYDVPYGRREEFKHTEDLFEQAKIKQANEDSDRQKKLQAKMDQMMKLHKKPPVEVELSNWDEINNQPTEDLSTEQLDSWFKNLASRNDSEPIDMERVRQNAEQQILENEQSDDEGEEDPLVTQLHNIVLNDTNNEEESKESKKSIVVPNLIKPTDQEMEITDKGDWSQHIIENPQIITDPEYFNSEAFNKSLPAHCRSEIIYNPQRQQNYIRITCQHDNQQPRFYYK